jgi:hypothetical protein
MNRRSGSDEVRLPRNEEPVAAVTIFDGNGSIVRVVPAMEFRRATTIRIGPGGGRGTSRTTAGGARVRSYADTSSRCSASGRAPRALALTRSSRD